MAFFLIVLLTIVHVGGERVTSYLFAITSAIVLWVSTNRARGSRAFTLRLGEPVSVEELFDENAVAGYLAAGSLFLLAAPKAVELLKEVGALMERLG
ncbi:hypothetical protein ACXR2T_13615 [Leucobacter sp. HY1910]